jgi:ADP-ribosylglycohydrolase
LSAGQDTHRAARLAGGVWGHLVGDAVGVPYEFREPVAVGSITFGATGTHGQPSGTWSDDGSLMLALLDSLLQGTFDPEDQGRRIVAWYRRKAYTPDGDGAFDVGNTTRAAITALERETPAERAGGTDEYSNGNGSLMRILPIALVYADRDDSELMDLAHRASAVTHRTERAMVACALYCLVAKRLLQGMDRAEALTESRNSLRDIYGRDRRLVDALDHLERHTDRGGRGRVWDSFWSAWDAFAGADSYEETIKRAIAYGHDTDTTAAIAGGLAGTYWTVDGISAQWLDGMRGRDVVEPLVDMLASATNKSVRAARVG